MITKTFEFTAEGLACMVSLPEEYGNYQVVVELRSYPNQDMPDEYIDVLKKRFEEVEGNQLLVVVKQVFNKEYWTKYYQEKEQVDICTCCGQKVPEGFYNVRLQEAEERAKDMWGFKVLDEKYILDILEHTKQLVKDAE